MTTFAVVGGTGTVGSHIAAGFRSAGHQARVLSRHSESHPVDLRSGRGLREALEGADVVVDAANGPPRSPEPVLVQGTRHLLAAASDAGVGRLLTVSIVGIERVPMGYYRAKLAQEELVRGAALPWTIVRSTQFHELVGAMLDALAARRISPRSAAPLQPIAAADAAGGVVAVALDPPAGATVNLAGPEALAITQLARAHARHQRRRLLALPLPLVGSAGRALRAGALTWADPDERGDTTWAQWLSKRS